MTASSSRVPRWAEWPVLAAATAYTAMKAYVRWDRGRDDPERGCSFADSAGESLYVTTPDGRQVHASVSGEGPDAVFCVHGWCCHGDFFHYQRELAVGRKVVTVDLRGHGRSDPETEFEYSVDKFAEDLRAVVDAVNPRRFVLMGHSMGGFTSFTFHRLFAGEYGRRLAGLVILDSTGMWLFDGVPGGGKLRGLLRNPAIYGALGKLARNPRPLEAAISRLKDTDLVYFLFRVFGFGPRPSPAMLDGIIEMTLGGPVSTLIMDAPACLEYEGAGVLPGVEEPVLLVTGTKDFFTNAATNRHTLDKLAHAELAVFRSGHGCPLDRHAEVNDAVERFLERVMKDGGD
jgi:pimeloyl-ACP methyl ester carboxylesterase